MRADVSLQYGGMFIRDEQDYFDVIKITDLASACGADGQVMVEALVTSFDYLNKGELKSMLDFSDCKRVLTRKDIGKADKRLLLAAEMISYGIYDLATSYHGPQTPFVAILDRAGHRDSREKWEVNVRGWGQAAFRRAVNLAIDTLA